MSVIPDRPAFEDEVAGRIVASGEAPLVAEEQFEQAEANIKQAAEDLKKSAEG